MHGAPENSVVVLGLVAGDWCLCDERYEQSRDGCMEEGRGNIFLLRNFVEVRLQRALPPYASCQ